MAAGVETGALRCGRQVVACGGDGRGWGLLLRSSVQLDDSWRGGRDPKKSEAGCRAGPATRPGGPVRTFWRRRPHRIYRLAPQLPAFGRGLVGLLCPVLGSGLGSRPPRPPLGAPGGPDFVTERPLVAATCNEMGAIAPLWLLVARRLGRIVSVLGVLARVLSPVSVHLGHRRPPAGRIVPKWTFAPPYSCFCGSGVSA